jgi:hypothetical protein
MKLDYKEMKILAKTIAQDLVPVQPHGISFIGNLSLRILIQG